LFRSSGFPAAVNSFGELAGTRKTISLLGTETIFPDFHDQEGIG
jgi:hypothetical protein